MISIIAPIGQQEPRLERAHDIIRGFITSCSHSLRGPLKSIEGLTHLLQAGDSMAPADRATFLQLITDTARKMEGMLDELEHFLENNQRTVVVRPVDVNALVNEIMRVFAETMRTRGIELSFRRATHGMVQTDPHRVRLILTNLLSNAASFYDTAKTNRTVHIEAMDEPEGLQLLVEDNGIGIAPEQLPHIFQIFVRASERSGGAGIGLYVVKGVVEKLAGTIRATSQPGIGTRFLVTLPHLGPASPR